MSTLYAYICTKSTYDPVIPTVTADIRILARDVSDSFASIAGGFFQVGKISLFPLQKAVPFHLLCDGSEVSQVSFPELFEYLGTSQGTPVDPANFVLPDFIGGTFTPAATATPETVSGGTIATSGGVVNSGGRLFDTNEDIP